MLLNVSNIPIKKILVWAAMQDRPKLDTNSEQIVKFIFLEGSIDFGTELTIASPFTSAFRNIKFGIEIVFFL